MHLKSIIDIIIKIMIDAIGIKTFPICFMDKRRFFKRVLQKIIDAMDIIIGDAFTIFLLLIMDFIPQNDPYKDMQLRDII